MACRLLLLAAVACLPALASATEWKIGDGGGWRAKFNQTGWADGKPLRVGDTLSCNLQDNPIGSWNSGNDVVHLDKPGKKWFICSVPNHCDNGMKLVLNVLEEGVPAPAPWAPSSSAPVSYTVGGAVAAAGAVLAF